MRELEDQLKSLKKKQLEMAKMLKFKEQSENRVNYLSKEIQAMKATRVKLRQKARGRSRGRDGGAWSFG